MNAERAPAFCRGEQIVKALGVPLPRHAERAGCLLDMTEKSHPSGGRRSAAATTSSASANRPRRVSASTVNVAAQATATGGEVFSLKSSPILPSAAASFQAAKPAQDHRPQAAGFGGHVHRAPGTGVREHRVADRSCRGKLVVPDQHEHGHDRRERVSSPNAADPGGLDRGQSRHRLAARAGGERDRHGVVNVPVEDARPPAPVPLPASRRGRASLPCGRRGRTR
jgi:hypothetical protein